MQLVCFDQVANCSSKGYVCVCVSAHVAAGLLIPVVLLSRLPACAKFKPISKPETLSRALHNERRARILQKSHSGITGLDLSASYE